MQSQIDQIENLNQSIKVELQEVIEDKRNLSTELAEIENDRESLKAQLQTMEEQVYWLFLAPSSVKLGAERLCSREGH